MQIHARKITMAAALLLFCLAITVVSSSAKAVDAVWIAHGALRSKILHEASDRYGVEFLKTHVDKLSAFGRRVTGTGRFRRRGKRPQFFTYHSTVNLRSRRDHDTGYDIQ